MFDLDDTLLQGKDYNLEGGIRRLLSLTDQAPLFNQNEYHKNSELLYNGIAYSFENSRKQGDLLGKASERIRLDANYEVNFEAFHRNLFDRMGLTSKFDWKTLDLEFLKVSHIFDIEENALEMLKTLQQNEIKMGVVSNSFHCGNSLEWLLNQAGIRHYFEFVISSADYGFRKPHPELFDTAIARLGIERERIWFIGDKPEYDILGAKNSGITSVWYNADGESAADPTPDIVLKNWRELGDILRLKNHNF